MNIVFRKLYYAFPVNLRYMARRLVYLPADLFRDKNSLVSPKGKIFIGRGDFLAQPNFSLILAITHHG